MTRRFLKDIPPGSMIEDEIFCVRDKDLRSTTNGSLYIHAVLSDRSGQLPARMWQATQELYSKIEQDGFIRIKGRSENYKGTAQIIIEGLWSVDVSEVNIEDFLPATEKDVEQMYKRMLEILRTIKDKHILYLIKQFVEDKELMTRFKKAPAAVSNHHAYLGGLLEHTLNVMELAMITAPLYKEINYDILVASAFLHDIGKTAEFAWDTTLKYTDSGQLLGHLIIGTMMIEQKAKDASAILQEDFPPRLLQVLEHIVISHHGEYEHGSAKLPMTTEALVLHHLDNLDAKVDMVKRQLAETEADSDWSKYHNKMERRFFKG